MDGRLAAGFALAALAAACYDAGLALQALEARRIPHDHALRPSLFARLARRRVWLAGTALSILGWPLQIAALALAPLTLVQPTLALGLLLLLWLGVAWLRERVGAREIAATTVVIAGVAALALVAPEHTDSHAGAVELAAALTAAGLVACAPYLPGARARVPPVLVMLAAGTAYAWSAFSSKLIADELAAGRPLWVAVWAAATALVAAVGLLSEMTALQRRPATRVAPVVFVAQAAVPVLLAPLLGGERWSDTPLDGGVIVLALLAVAAGAAVLASSSAVSAMVDAAAHAPAASPSAAEELAGGHGGHAGRAQPRDERIQHERPSDGRMIERDLRDRPARELVDERLGTEPH
jgi:drug/metabolite transporter (DMT)-like permease